MKSPFLVDWTPEVLFPIELFLGFVTFARWLVFPGPLVLLLLVDQLGNFCSASGLGSINLLLEFQVLGECMSAGLCLF